MIEGLCYKNYNHVHIYKVHARRLWFLLGNFLLNRSCFSSYMYIMLKNLADITILARTILSIA